MVMTLFMAAMESTQFMVVLVATQLMVVSMVLMITAATIFTERQVLI